MSKFLKKLFLEDTLETIEALQNHEKCGYA